MEIDDDLFDLLYKRDIPFKSVKCISKDAKMLGIQQALTRRYVDEMNTILELNGVNKRVEDQIRDILLEKLTDGLIEQMNNKQIKCFNVLKNNVMTIEESEIIIYYRIMIKYDEILNLDNKFL